MNDSVYNNYIDFWRHSVDLGVLSENTHSESLVTHSYLAKSSDGVRCVQITYPDMTEEVC